MSVYIQNPPDPSSPYLLERLLDSCRGATRGGAAFAWATSTGISLLFQDPTFTSFLGKGKFDLLLGIDAITNRVALAKLTSVMAIHSKLTARIFLHDRPAALFHPKVCWFLDSQGCTVITGSGNLTLGGLRSNWEAFSVARLSKPATRAFLAEWDAWADSHKSILFDPGHPSVVAEADKNKGWQSRKKSSTTSVGSQEAVTVEAPSAELQPPLAPNLPVLVAEIPKAGTRWHQANFDVASYEQFFGAKVGTQRRILLQHVSDAGQLQEIESRPSVQVKSHNYRFELGAASGNYPKGGPPIAVFVRQPTGVFAYRLLVPGDSGYSEAQSLLNAKWTGAKRLMRRVTTAVDELKMYWPDAPFWALVPAIE